MTENISIPYQQKSLTISSEAFMGGRWDSNPRPPEPQSGVLTN